MLWPLPLQTDVMITDSVWKMEIIVGTSRNEVSKLLEEKEQKWDERSPGSLQPEKNLAASELMVLTPKQPAYPVTLQASAAALREPTALAPPLQKLVLDCLLLMHMPSMLRTKVQPHWQGNLRNVVYRF